MSHLVPLGLCVYIIWIVKFDLKPRRFCLRSSFYNYGLALLATCCAAEPLFRLVVGLSIFDLEQEIGLAPFEVVHLVIEFISWCSMILMFLVETKMYVKEFRWHYSAISHSFLRYCSVQS